MDFKDDVTTNGSVVETVPRQAQSSVTAGDAADVPPVRKYVHLEGRAIVNPAIIRENNEDVAVLQVAFVDGNFVPLADTSTLSVYAGDKGLRLMCHHLHMIASLSKQGYIDNVNTLKIINPLLEDWDDLEASKNTADMTPTGPPKT
ncbi:hypothetical protein J2I47_12825 [Fibrella sp. HMF5335]|uniref:Uncharacterized protein n=1 Tax=Fibrella rubiginis TaxID=2817060 RepID=A0A939K1R7_9BACT|nr:hypothetical protein [Fibrella rubiginis]MBO0937432.1 hypothetical protein [Fibrella rubiginis]